MVIKRRKSTLFKKKSYLPCTHITVDSLVEHKYKRLEVIEYTVHNNMLRLLTPTGETLLYPAHLPPFNHEVVTFWERPEKEVAKTGGGAKIYEYKGKRYIVELDEDYTLTGWYTLKPYAAYYNKSSNFNNKDVRRQAVKTPHHFQAPTKMVGQIFKNGYFKGRVDRIYVKENNQIRYLKGVYEYSSDEVISSKVTVVVNFSSGLEWHVSARHLHLIL